MRVTAETRDKTRQRILDSARKLLFKKGFQETTTRDIASAARIASGTLFNYFPSKEALVSTLLVEAFEHTEKDFMARRKGRESLVEDLFLFVMTGLRRLEPHRAYIAAALDCVLSPFARNSATADEGSLRARHLEQVADILHRHGISLDNAAVTMHLYWSLYIGVLSFWTGDDSPHQEDTLALLDRSLQLFVASLTNNIHPTEVTHAS
jgi:AcrR family transcriptional regulator